MSTHCCAARKTAPQSAYKTGVTPHSKPEQRMIIVADPIFNIIIHRTNACSAARIVQDCAVVCSGVIVLASVTSASAAMAVNNGIFAAHGFSNPRNGVDPSIEALI